MDDPNRADEVRVAARAHRPKVAQLPETIERARSASLALRKRLLSGWTREEIALAETIRQSYPPAPVYVPQAHAIDHPDNLELARWALGRRDPLQAIAEVLHGWRWSTKTWDASGIGRRPERFLP